MRVFFPATVPRLGAVAAAGRVEPPPLLAFAVTPALREWYVEGDREELEYAAFSEAARASLRLLAEDPAAPRRRVVLAAEVPDDAVRPVGAPTRGAVQVGVGVPLAAVASIHVDDAAAGPAVAEAALAIAAADRGDADAEFTVTSADDHALAWYATQELPDLLADLT
ncbi:MAG TPA: hypothetical protein VKP64_02155 [Mycobacteriales bacterium]|nr:hypothetical protein [Mycobacteriales bacterium]